MTEYVWIVINEDGEPIFVSGTEHGVHIFIRDEIATDFTMRDAGMISDHDAETLVTRSLVEWKDPDCNLNYMMTVECWQVSRPIDCL